MSDFTDCPCALLDGTPQLGEIWADIDPANVPWLLPLDLMCFRWIGCGFLDVLAMVLAMCAVFFLPRYYDQECSGEPENHEFRMLTEGPPHKNPLDMRFLNLSHTRFLI